MHIALVYNLREESALGDDPNAEPPSHVTTDDYAEWDDIHTIAAIEKALARVHQVSLVNADLDAFEKLRRLKPDLVFNIAEGLHGASREAQLPAICEMLQLPYTGSEPLALGLALDKCRTKEILSQHKVPTPRFWLVNSTTELSHKYSYPLLVKPPREGSSKGVTNKALVHNRQELHEQVEWVLNTYQQRALVEEFLPGREFTVALIGNADELRVLPIVEINFDSLPPGVNPIYSYEAKWIWDTEHNPLQIFTCPAKLEPLLQQQIEGICRNTFKALGCRDWCRIDVRLDTKGYPQIIELNPLPGILPRPEQNSCFPKAARAAGIDYDQLILNVVDAACTRLKIGQGDAHENRCLL
jgi:D-alanine-D-alanine ligase